jgi:membrane protein
MTPADDENDESTVAGIERRSLRFARRFIEEWRDDRVPDLAAEVAFWAILSLFPALVALASVLGALDSVAGSDVAARVEENVLDGLRSILTGEASGTIDAVADLFAESRPGLLTFSLVIAIWTLSRGFAALVRALDVVYDLHERRSWFRIRGTALVLGLGSIVAGGVMLALIVIGPLLGTGEDVADTFGLESQFATAWDVLRLPLAGLLLVGWAATIFHIAPNHHTRWRADLPGAIVTTVLWLAFSAGLRVYVDIAQRGNAVFGTLGGVLIVLLWFWLLSLAILVGGEVNELLLEGDLEAETMPVIGRIVAAPSAGVAADSAGDSGDSAGVEGPTDVGDEVTGVDGAPAVEEDAHDRGRDHDTVGGP